MSGAQKENGFTQVAHEILDNIVKYKFNGAQFRIIMKIWRMTYGYHRKDKDFSITFLHQETGLSEGAVKKALSYLIKSKVLVVTKKQTGTTSRWLAFNKYFDQWKVPKGGDSMSKESVNEVYDQTPHGVKDEVYDQTPHEVYDQTPQSNEISYFEVYDQTPIKRYKRSLNILKDNVDGFDKFYSIYPRKVSKAAAKKAWDKLAKEGGFNPELIIQNTLNYADTCRLIETETRYIPHPSTYLNQRRFEDYPVIDPEGLSQQKKGKSKFERNKVLLLGGGGPDDGERSEVPAIQSIRSLPRPD